MTKTGKDDGHKKYRSTTYRDVLNKTKKISITNQLKKHTMAGGTYFGVMTSNFQKIKLGQFFKNAS